MSDITVILSSIERGDPQAAARLLPLVYDQLRKLARDKLTKEKPGQTLQATALVHEAYLRLTGQARGPDDARVYGGRDHFFAAAATAMRHVLIDSARRKLADKRGGGSARLEPAADALDRVAAPAPSEELMALDEALRKLAEQDPQKARLVELRFFAGLSGEEAAQVLGISPSTADRHWAYARAWLKVEICGR